MHILLDLENGPIYEQIKGQIKEQILSGSLSPNQMLPSIRTLAKELKVGIITAKRAYDDLAAEGFTYSVQGKGVFVANITRDKIDEISYLEIEKNLHLAVQAAKLSGLPKVKFTEIVDKVCSEENL
ncbi:MAG: GntR family transcriptional regulator [Candidatus Coproplasma sp.]